MSRRWLPIPALCLLLAPLSACQSPPRTAPLAYDAFIDTTLTTLRLEHFDPRRADRATGLIVTERETGAQWFEFWRNDSQGSYQLLESSLHTIGRVVTIDITPVDASEPTTQPAGLSPVTVLAAEESSVGLVLLDEGPYRVAVRVEKSRLSTPPRQITTASGAMGMYSERVPTTRGIVGPASRRGAHWVPLGRDELLEQRLLVKIAEAAAFMEPAEAVQPADAQP